MKKVFLIGSGNGWVLDEEARSLQRALTPEIDTKIIGAGELSHIRESIVHFVDRYQFLGSAASVHPSNRIIVSWYHGSPSDDHSNIQSTCNRFRDLAHYCERVVTPCSSGYRGLIEIGIAEEKIESIPTGVELELFKSTHDKRTAVRSSLGILEDSFCIGSFVKDGNGFDEGLEPKAIKAPEVLIAALKNLAERHDDFVVLLTGPARGYVKRELDAAKISYIHRYVEDYSEMAYLYTAADACFVTSRIEGGPKCLLESWASQVPVVTTKVGMAEDLISDGENGFITEIDDVAGLSERLSRLLESKELRQQIHSLAYRQVQNYAWSTIARQYCSRLYSQRP